MFLRPEEPPTGFWGEEIEHLRTDKELLLNENRKLFKENQELKARLRYFQENITKFKSQFEELLERFKTFIKPA